MDPYCIISDSQKGVSKTNIEKLEAAVFVHLFYEEQVDFYRNYLNRIPDFIDVIIISSKDKILESFHGGRFKTIKKENRGRDISALLVAAKNLIFQYEYICFIHDKKEKWQNEKEYVDAWIKNLWDNMLQSSIYIYNVLDAFQNNKIGMMVPLPPYGREDAGVWLKGEWGNNFENVHSLARSLGISENVHYESLLISYSTVFWARTKVLKKLYSKDWSYTDFPQEPMGYDGEINHAIERILQYVTEDAGYETKIVLSASFAEAFITQLHRDINGLWDKLDNTFGITTYRGLHNYNHIKTFANEHSDIYLYGAGKIGKECLKICRSLNIVPKGFIVTEDKNSYEEMEIPVFSVSNFTFAENIGIIISVSFVHKEDIKKELEKRGFYEYMIY
ncbi:MAG: rhamnan synthesis F family protein [Lachnospiraceae bacterium]